MTGFGTTGSFAGVSGTSSATATTATVVPHVAAAVHQETITRVDCQRLIRRTEGFLTIPSTTSIVRAPQDSSIESTTDQGAS